MRLSVILLLSLLLGCNQASPNPPQEKAAATATAQVAAASGAAEVATKEALQPAVEGADRKFVKLSIILPADSAEARAVKSLDGTDIVTGQNLTIDEINAISAMVNKRLSAEELPPHCIKHCYPECETVCDEWPF